MTKGNKITFLMVNKYDEGNKLYTEKDVRLRDHCHKTGKYRGFVY